MDIKTYWAKLVASGLAFNYRDIWALYDSHSVAGGGSEMRWSFVSSNPDDEDLDYFDFVPTCEIENPNKELQRFISQLRKDSVDLYYLAWKKPALHDDGKLCWFMDDDNIILTNLDINLSRNDDPDLYSYFVEEAGCFYTKYCLLAEHGQISPTEQDFKKVYGE